MLSRNAGSIIFSLSVLVGVCCFVLNNNDNGEEMLSGQGAEEPVGNADDTNQGEGPVQKNEGQGDVDFNMVDDVEADNGAGSAEVDVPGLRIEQALQRGVNDEHAPPPSLYEPDNHDPSERFDVVDDAEAARVREEDRHNNRPLEDNTTFVLPPPLHVEDNRDPLERFDVVDDAEAARVREEDRHNNRPLEDNTAFVPPPPLYGAETQQMLGLTGGSGLHAL